MTEYNGQTITYDKIGNPLTYRDGMTMTWKRGRQLTALQTEGNSIQYKYDSDSIRTSKIVNGVVHTYEYLNGLLMHETRGEQAYDYYYDANGQLYAVSYKLSETDTKKVYYFTHNWRGDIVGIYNGNGDLKATYEYDAWGNVISIEDAGGNAITSATHIANLNPFRYRGYYMDTETGLYYLMSRYYDPVTHRFVNADGYFQSGASLLDTNMNAYCGNNPINNSDPNGQNFFKDALKWIATNIIKPIVNTVKRNLAKENRTTTYAIAGTATPGFWNFNYQVGISMDNKGNVAVQSTKAGGITTGTAGASIAGVKTVTNAPDIYHLEGQGAQVGGSVGIPIEAISIVGCGELNIIPDSESGTLYYGVTEGVGIGPPVPSLEGHVEWGETVTWDSTVFNVFDVADNIYNKIMEW